MYMSMRLRDVLVVETLRGVDQGQTCAKDLKAKVTVIRKSKCMSAIFGLRRNAQ